MKKIFVLCMLALPVLGQKKESKIESHGKIRVERDHQGKREVIEREFNLDSLPVHASIFSDSSTNLMLHFGEGRVWVDDVARSIRRARTHLNGIRPAFSFSEDGVLRTFSEGFSNVSVFTNKPDTRILNVRFSSSKEEEVHITVVDPQGKVIEKEKVKDFKKEYMGQLELPKGTKGVVFVLIAQGEQAISRKVLISE